MMAVRGIRRGGWHSPLPKVHAVADNDPAITLCGRGTDLLIEDLRRQFEGFPSEARCVRCERIAEIAPDVRCALCGEALTGFGHNPEPLAGADERCCDDCNVIRVIPARLDIGRRVEAL